MRSTAPENSPDFSHPPQLDSVDEERRREADVLMLAAEK